MYQKGDILRQQFRLEQQLGIGGFSEVWKATDMDAQDIVAIKLFHKQDEEGIELCREEYRRLNYLSHPNILKPRFFSHAESAPFFVMPFCESGSTADRSGFYNESDLGKLVWQISSALHHIHSLHPPMLHNDIKPDNILEAQPGEFMLADFGLSERFSKKLTQSIPDDMRTELMNQDKRAGMAPMAYRAPELFNFSGRPAQQPSTASDIWAFGATLCQLAGDELPFDKEGGLRQLTYEQTNNNLNIDDIVAPLPNQYSRDLDLLVKKCLALNPTDRPTAHYLFEKAEQFIKTGQWNIERDYAAGKTNVYSDAPAATNGMSLSVSPMIIDFKKTTVGKTKVSNLDIQYAGLKDNIYVSTARPFAIAQPGQPARYSLELPTGINSSGAHTIEVHYFAEQPGDIAENLYVAQPEIGQEVLRLEASAHKPWPPGGWWPYVLVGTTAVVVLGLFLTDRLLSHKIPPDIKQPVVIQTPIASGATIGQPTTPDQINNIQNPTVSSNQNPENQKDKFEYNPENKYPKDTETESGSSVGVVDPKRCNPEITQNRFSNAGALSSDRCGADGEKIWVRDAEIVLKPKKDLVLKSAVVFADNSGTLRITIRNTNANDCSQSYSQNLAKGRCQINFLEDFTLVNGQTYNIKIATTASNVSPTPPKLENLNPCNPGLHAAKELNIEYRGNVALMDLRYAY